MKESAPIGIIGGADGPTSILVAGKVGTGYFAAAILLGAVLIVLGIVLKRGTTMVHHQKYFKNLFYIQISALILSILSVVPGINTVTDWANGIIQLFIIVIMFLLTAMHERYRKAAIFLRNGWIHSDQYADGYRNSHVCNFHMFVNFHISGIQRPFSDDRKSGCKFGRKMATVVLGVALSMDTNILSSAVVWMITGVDGMIRVIYLVYIKRMSQVLEEGHASHV